MCPSILQTKQHCEGDGIFQQSEQVQRADNVIVVTRNSPPLNLSMLSSVIAHLSYLPRSKYCLTSGYNGWTIRSPGMTSGSLAHVIPFRACYVIPTLLYRPIYSSSTHLSLSLSLSYIDHLYCVHTLNKYPRSCSGV